MKEGELISVPPNDSDTLRATKMDTPQIDFPIIPTEEALKRLRHFVHHTPIYKRSALRTLHVINVEILYMV